MPKVFDMAKGLFPFQRDFLMQMPDTVIAKDTFVDDSHAVEVLACWATMFQPKVPQELRAVH